MPSATTLVYGALRLCNGGLARPGRTASPEELADGLLRLNDLVDAWGVERLTMYQLLRTLKTLASGTPTYTIGAGGSINMVRPDRIDYARLIIDTSASPVTEIDVAIWTDQQWAAISQKTLTNPLPHGIYYDRGWTAGLGLISIWPIPNVGTTQLVLYTKQALTAFADLTTVYTFPPGYAEALRYNLALRLAPEFGGVRDTGTVQLAKDALGKIKRANIQAVQVGVDSALLSPRDGMWNWYTGEIGRP